MFNWDDVLIIGDSFVASRTQENDWPKLLTKLITGKIVVPRGFGFSGCSWWSARRLLLDELKKKKPKVLVLAHTEPSRLPNDKDLPLNAMTVETRESFNNSTLEYEDMRKAAQGYYKHLMSRDFHIWTQQQWFIELDRIIEEHDIPYVIHLHCFMPYTPEVHEFKNGITFDTPLWELSDDIKQWSTSNRNHFSIEKNKLIANNLYQAFLTYSNGKRSLDI